jgi:HEPN domain-containing protein
MPPEQDARAILRLALRHEQSLAADLDPAFSQENWGFLAQQGVENVLKGFIVLADVQPPLTHDLARLAQLAGVRLSEDLLALQDFAVKARTLRPAHHVRLISRPKTPWRRPGCHQHRRLHLS